MKKSNSKKASARQDREDAKRLRAGYKSTKKNSWQKLDNTANLFPAIATHTMTNVYRIAVSLHEEIDKKLLQRALDMVLPEFDTFNVHMRRGVFWYYFETMPNGKRGRLLRRTVTPDGYSVDENGVWIQ